MKIEQRQIELGGLPAQVLFDIARNPSADPLWRKAAVRMMLDKGYPQVDHEELAVLLMQVRAEKDAETEVESLVESQVEQPSEEFHGQTLSASVTTASLQQDEVIVRNPAALNEDALTGE